MSAVSVGRAPSGARLQGDDVQHLIAWYHVLCTQRVDNRVTALAVEAAGAGNVDDLTLEFADGTREYWQVKASVDTSTPLTEAWLFALSRKGPSLLQRLHTSWQALAQGGRRPRLVLATTKSIDPEDEVLTHRAVVDGRLADALGTAALATARTRWAQHLGVNAAELLDFLSDLEIRHGQTEREWRSKVHDAAYGAGVQRTAAAIALGLQRVRDWVKRPRTVLTPASINAALIDLRILDTDPHRRMILQALEHHPDAGSATYSTDWVSLFDGDDPRTRRAFKDPSSAAVVKTDLAVARRRLRAAGISALEVAGTMRLPLWFTVGTELTQTAGFVLTTRAGRECWSSDTRPDPDPGLCFTLDDPKAIRPGLPLVVSINISLDIHRDVQTYASSTLPEANVLKIALPRPSGHAVEDQAHATGIAVSIRDGLRTLWRDDSPSEIHVFLAAPSAVVLFLGHLWDRMPSTTVYWDLGQPGRYAPAFHIGI
ncbi:MAG: SAVED domain-containing protein [Kineosporiaceae bacterium]|nr:SAVED domain-containing protein [Kineosporiaceae bacterium]MBK7622571.1 SAVED domain-containing protein [Kineosporiaceae bacterium]